MGRQAALMDTGADCGNSNIHRDADWQVKVEQARAKFLSTYSGKSSTSTNNAK